MLDHVEPLLPLSCFEKVHWSCRHITPIWSTERFPFFSQADLYSNKRATYPGSPREERFLSICSYVPRRIRSIKHCTYLLAVIYRKPQGGASAFKDFKPQIFNISVYLTILPVLFEWVHKWHHPLLPCKIKFTLPIWTSLNAFWIASSILYNCNIFALT